MDVKLKVSMALRKNSKYVEYIVDPEFGAIACVIVIYVLHFTSSIRNAWEGGEVLRISRHEDRFVKVDSLISITIWRRNFMIRYKKSEHIQRRYAPGVRI
jgi:hypothetical protein